MQNRLYHRPVLHVPEPGVDRKVGWLELFYDLIYVAAILQAGTALSHHVDGPGFIGFAAIFVPIWFTWTGFTFYVNRFKVDDAIHRAVVFLQMFAIGGVAIAIPRVFEGDMVGFCLAYGLARLCMVAMHTRTWLQVGDAAEMGRYYARGFGVGAALWLLSATLPLPWAWLTMGVAMFVDLSTALNRGALGLIARFPPDIGHISERYGLLILIVLGESFVKVLTELADQGATPATAAMAALGLVITCCLWWIYFDDVAGARVKSLPLAPIIWVYGHLPLAISMTAVGVALKKASLDGPMDLGTAKYRWFLCGTLALALGSVAIIDAVTERQADLPDQTRVMVRAASAITVLLLAPLGGVLPTWAFLSLVVSVCVAQVAFDLSMAPLAPEAHETPIHRPGPSAPVAPPPGTPRRFTPNEAVRLGTPAEMRRDLYFHFLEGTWPRVILSMAFIYFMGNVLFAALYMVDLEGITNTHPSSFADAFFFSVQTMATIGYGVLAPQDTYSNVLVTVEAGLAMVGVAVMTGLVFARISRPRSAALFSRVVVVTRMHGKPTLMFRVGNARGNEVVEASVRVSALKDEETDGHVFRRLVDLKLVRDNQPLFTLSWSVMHVIDETSPLHGMDLSNLDKMIRMLLCTLTGHDGTYNTTIYARHMWYPEDIRWQHRFVDVISSQADGRLVVDYDRFHDVMADPVSPVTT